MFLYKVGYNSYEECPEIVLAHHRDIPGEEFEDLCLSCCEAVAKGMVASGESLHNFSDMYEKVADMLVERAGFEHADFSASFSPFGWASVLDNEDWATQRGDELNKITNRLLAAGLTKEDDSMVKFRREEGGA
jgi:hypothetical protein